MSARRGTRWRPPRALIAACTVAGMLAAAPPAPAGGGAEIRIRAVETLEDVTYVHGHLVSDSRRTQVLAFVRYRGASGLEIARGFDGEPVSATLRWTSGERPWTIAFVPGGEVREVYAIACNVPFAHPKYVEKDRETLTYVAADPVPDIESALKLLATFNWVPVAYTRW